MTGTYENILKHKDNGVKKRQSLEWNVFENKNPFVDLSLVNTPILDADMGEDISPKKLVIQDKERDMKGYKVFVQVISVRSCPGRDDGQHNESPDGGQSEWREVKGDSGVFLFGDQEWALPNLPEESNYEPYEKCVRQVDQFGIRIDYNNKMEKTVFFQQQHGC